MLLQKLGKQGSSIWFCWINWILYDDQNKFFFWGNQNFVFFAFKSKIGQLIWGVNISDYGIGPLWQLGHHHGVLSWQGTFQGGAHCDSWNKWICFQGPDKMTLFGGFCYFMCRPKAFLHIFELHMSSLHWLDYPSNFLFSYNGAYWIDLMLSICDVIVSQKLYNRRIVWALQNARRGRDGVSI